MAGRASISRNRNSWGPISISSNGSYRLSRDDFDDEEEDEYKSVQARQLDPLKEDLADWLNRILGIDYLSKDNFLDELDNGVVLCHLAQVICDLVRKVVTATGGKGPSLNVRGKCFEKASRRSFFSRDNMENFIKFCRSLGVHENLLFESDDLVLHNQPRNVVLCLLEVARIASKYGLEPPGIVQLERQILEEERASTDGSRLSSLLAWHFDQSPPTPMRQSASADAIASALKRWGTPEHTTGGASDGVPSDHTEDEEWSRGSGEDPSELDAALPPRQAEGERASPVTELDRKVQLAAKRLQKNCSCTNGKCDKLRIRKVGEGKYNIAGKNVFIRLLKGRHMMVRVGGGWDTLDHFLLRHDPCQVKVVSRQSPQRPNSVAIDYLQINAKYRIPQTR